STWTSPHGWGSRGCATTWCRTPATRATTPRCSSRCSPTSSPRARRSRSTRQAAASPPASRTTASSCSPRSGYGASSMRSTSRTSAPRWMSATSCASTRTPRSPSPRTCPTRWWSTSRTSTSARPMPTRVPAGSAAAAASTCAGRWSATATSTFVQWPARSATPTSPAMPRSSSRAGRTASWAASAGSPTPRTCSPDPHVKETLMTKFRVGVIGAGSIAQSHLAAYSANEDVELIAVADMNLERAQAVAEKHGAERAYADPHELLADPEIDGVSICTWNNSHASWAIAAVEAGKHVLVEKPLARTLAEAEELQRVVEAGDSVVQVGFVRRHSPNCQVLKSFIDADELGEIYY